jgi:predicted DNA-binding transcriptional regulator AlpA
MATNSTGLSGTRIPPVDNQYLSEKQVSEKYRLARRTLQRWRVTGEGPPFVRLGPKRIVYRLSDCEAWAAARTFPHRAAEEAKSAGGSASASPPLRRHLAPGNDRADSMGNR